jgi:protein gp37
MPAQKKKPANISVCSMADLFEEWVPDEWIKEVLAACAAAPWHNYMFLTKNPERYPRTAEAYGNLKMSGSGQVSQNRRTWIKSYNCLRISSFPLL